MFFRASFITFDKAVENMARNKRILSDEFRAWKGEATKLKVQHGWTNRELAVAAPMSIYQVNNYMSGNYPNDYPKEPIERALGMR